MIYLTFGDKYSGVFQSQVIDVLKYINKTNSIAIKLISFVPYPEYKEQKRLIKLHYPDAYVFPMVPSRNQWIVAHSILLIFSTLFTIQNQKVVCRGIWSANIGLLLRKLRIVKWVCYDGRGAVFAEWKEYLIHGTRQDLNEIYKAERNAVQKTDHRIAVSHALVDYWKNNYQYKLGAEAHSIIPCTLGKSYENFIGEKERLLKRQQLGYKLEDIVILFSGGVDKWQSPEMLGAVMKNLQENNKNIKFLFLTKPQIVDHPAISPFRSLIKRFWVNPDEVSSFLAAGDFALLIRERSVTNKVSAPTKFAEYLGCGLEVIISKEVGDYTSFVKEHQCGIVYQEKALILKKKRSNSGLHDLAKNYYSKSCFSEKYRVVYT